MKRMKSLFLALILVLGLVGCGGSKEPTWQEQYDLGVRYLSEGNYEEAILAFEAAITIEPKRAEAYLSLSEAHLALGDTEAAAKALERGLSAVGENADLSDALAALDTQEPSQENSGGETLPESDMEFDFQEDEEGRLIFWSRSHDDGSTYVVEEYTYHGSTVEIRMTLTFLDNDIFDFDVIGTTISGSVTHTLSPDAHQVRVGGWGYGAVGEELDPLGIYSLYEYDADFEELREIELE